MGGFVTSGIDPKCTSKMHRLTHIQCALRLELDVALPLNKSSMPRYFSLAISELSEELSMRPAIELHALYATIGIALIRVEEAVVCISHYSSLLQVNVELTGSQSWSSVCLQRQ
jgi:hypothetical protein